MYEEETNYLKWNVTKKIVHEILTSISIDTRITKSILDELISENLIKEDMFEEDTISFAFERFFDYLTAGYINQKQQDQIISELERLSENIKTYGGTFEVLATLYKEKYNREIINELEEIPDAFSKLWLSSLTWRKTENIDDEETKHLIFTYLASQNHLKE